MSVKAKYNKAKAAKARRGHAERCDSYTKLMPGTNLEIACPCDCAKLFKDGPIEERVCVCGATFYEASKAPLQFPTAQPLWLCKDCAPTLTVVGVVNSRGQLMPKAGYSMPGMDL